MSPTDVNVEFINNNLHLTWREPYTLTNVPIFGYNITISNSTYYHNSTVPQFQLNAGSLLEHCQWYTVILYGINGAGAGNSASRTFFYPGGEPQNRHENNNC